MTRDVHRVVELARREVEGAEGCVVGSRCVVDRVEPGLRSSKELVDRRLDVVGVPFQDLLQLLLFLILKMLILKDKPQVEILLVEIGTFLLSILLNVCCMNHGFLFVYRMDFKLLIQQYLIYHGRYLKDQFVIENI